MKYTPSIAFNEMSGSAKGVTAAKVFDRKYIRNRGTGGSARTSLQAVVKSIFKQLSQSWKSLAYEEILEWNNLAQTQSGKRVLGSTCKITGANLFMRLNYWIVKCGGEMATTPPELVGVVSPPECDIDVRSDYVSIQIPDLPEDTTDIKFVVKCSAPQGMGISSAYDQCVQLGDPRDIQEDPYDLTDEYIAQFGAPTSAQPKVFFKYFYVNTVTGEKSGELQGFDYVSKSE